MLFFFHKMNNRLDKGTDSFWFGIYSFGFGSETCHPKLVLKHYLFEILRVGSTRYDLYSLGKKKNSHRVCLPFNTNKRKKEIYY